MASNKIRNTSSGVLVCAPDGQILLGNATGTRRWDIPKGLVEPGEPWSRAAARELEEETGLLVAASALNPVGHYAYLPGKDLALFAWFPPAPLDPAALRCRSTFTARDGRQMPELARFAFFTLDRALEHVGKNMARVLASLDWPSILGRR